MLAAGAEMLAMWGPRILILAFLGNEVSVEQRKRWRPPVRQRTRMANPGLVAGARLPAPVVEPERGEVQTFLKARTVARPNHRVRCGKVYESYRTWCAE
jgi:hypothetical protein